VQSVTLYVYVNSQQLEITVHTNSISVRVVLFMETRNKSKLMSYLYLVTAKGRSSNAFLSTNSTDTLFSRFPIFTVLIEAFSVLEMFRTTRSTNLLTYLLTDY